MPRLFLILILTGSLWGAEFRAPAENRPARPRPGATTVLPGGRLLEPHGRQHATGSGPMGLAVSPSGRFIATSDGGPDGFSISLLERDRRGRFRTRRIGPPAEVANEVAHSAWRAVGSGIEFAGDNQVFVSEGDSGRVLRVKLGKRIGLGEVYSLNTGDYRDSFSGELAYDPTGELLYVVDQANQRVVAIDANSKRIVGSVKAGHLPFAITLSPDGKRVYVTNVGMVQYSPIPGANESLPHKTGLAFPAFGFPSIEAMGGVRREAAGGPVDVPALGDPNAPGANSLCVIDVETPANPRVVKFIRTGKPMGEESAGGSSPSGVLATGNRIYVSNAHNDSVSVIDSTTLEMIVEIPIGVPQLDDLRGVLPVGMAFHPGTGWLFVAEAGINAVGVIDTASNEVIGHIPSAWYPVQVEVHGDDVFVSNLLGHGTGANANKMIAVWERESRGRRGTVTVFPVPAARELKNLTRTVMEANGFVPQSRARPPVYPGAVQHVVWIVKKSRTFDEVLGDMAAGAGGNVEGAPMLARFGRTGSAGDAGGGFQARFSLRGVNVTPNHHELASRWAFSDNFYSDAVSSVAAHHWLTGVVPSPWTVRSFLAASAGNKRYRWPTTALGRLHFPGGSASVHPEEIPERGTLWHHLERNGIEFRNFGEGLELAGVYQEEGFQPTGARYLTNVPMPDVLYRNTSRDYPLFNTTIPDQYRATRFIDEIERLYRRPGKALPRFLYVQLPNDVTALARPDGGYPFTASFVADNDYALGRIVEYLSGTPWWKSMVIFVTEDDGHGGVDHVDSHRVPPLVIGPNVRRGYVSHRNTSFPGLLKTTFQILGLPPLNLFDAAATDLSDFFTETADYAPYEVLEIQKELFVPANAVSSKSRR